MSVVECRGDCHCESCAPKNFPLAEFVREGHISFRFPKDQRPAPKMWRVWLNEIEVTNQCFEALPGVGGWVLIYCTHGGEQSGTKMCPCDRGACSRWVRGNVRTERTFASSDG